MAKWDITGEWVGEYAFDPGPAYPTLPTGIRFTLVVRQGWFGRFRGTAQDAAKCFSVAPATIVGRVAGLKLSFRKLYPEFYVASRDGGWATLRDYIEGELALPLDQDVPPDPVWYSGGYDPDEQTARGTWRIEAGVLQFWSRGRRCTSDWPGTSGTWVMRRLG
jgi:hypothetical protein